MRTIVVTLCVRCLCFVLGAAPLSTIASETTSWTQQKSKCGLPSSLDYNTWVAQGSPCGNGGSGNGRGDSTDEQARQRAADQARQEERKHEEEKRSLAAAQTEGPIVGQSLNEQLVAAIKAADTAKAEALIAGGADVTAKGDRSYPLFSAVEHGNEVIAELLIGKGADVNDARGYKAETPLFYANKKNLVELLIAHGADVKAK